MKNLEVKLLKIGLKTFSFHEIRAKPKLARKSFYIFLSFIGMNLYIFLSSLRCYL